MAYTVNRTNSSASPNQYTVQDGVVNTQTDISFIGKGYAGYGEVIAENFLALLENFSNSSAPAKPITGQLWYDSGESRLKVYTGSLCGRWNNVSHHVRVYRQGDRLIQILDSITIMVRQNVLVGPTHR